MSDIFSIDDKSKSRMFKAYLRIIKTFKVDKFTPIADGITDESLKEIYFVFNVINNRYLKDPFLQHFILKSQVLLHLDKYGILNKKEFYDKNNMKKIKFATTITENDIKKENFIYSFLSSVRQKMLTKRK